MFSIFRMPLNHQAQGTSTWLIIGSNSHTAQPKIFCWGYVTPLWLSMPLFHSCTVHLNCFLLVSPNPIYLYTISCLCFSQICGITENQKMWAVSMQACGGGKHKHTNWKEGGCFWRFLRGLGVPDKCIPQAIRRGNPSWKPRDCTVSRWSLKSTQVTKTRETFFRIDTFWFEMPILCFGDQLSLYNIHFNGLKGDSGVSVSHRSDFVHDRYFKYVI